MRMSTRTRFAVNALVDLGLRQQSGPVALAAICGRLQVSLSYMEQVFARMRRQGLVESTRGPGGGYTLGRRADAITIADIVSAVEDRPPAATEATPGQALWTELDAVMMQHMSGITLESLLEEQRAKGVDIEVAPRRRALAMPRPAPRALTTRAPNSVFAFARSLAD
ncbi:DNA-binding protein [Rubrivivax gelatinosus]|uniref:DNA-binding protein n=1 Tax=Rubrivivax gelatinosus TaxID=28068 RepID=A0ABS1DPU4_RUBGE|nr:Rrf2 family transcriptional regulator [Rubrivivax gelatinosus]MBK1614949.1 DNA-binding protein [Rubrivivax gelatinosus]MBK1712029.1 DNA-binding protein [Rubrivivax gelatinosus]